MRFVDELYQVFRILVPDLFPSVHTDVFCRSQKTNQIKTQKKSGEPRYTTQANYETNIICFYVFLMYTVPLR